MRSASLAQRVGFWSAAAVTGAGVVYFVGMIGLVATGVSMSPPPERAQVVVGAATFVTAQLILVLVAGVHASTAAEERVLSGIGLLFTTLFAGMVSINRFVQLSVVRNSVAAGETEGLERFLPYDSDSVMFALEILGWGFFLALAALFLAPTFRRGRLDRAIRASLLAYAALSLAGTLGYVLDSGLFLAGFLAWGLVLYVAAALLAVRFRRAGRATVPLA